MKNRRAEAMSKKQIEPDFDNIRKVIDDLHEKGEDEKLKQIATLLDHAIKQTDKSINKLMTPKLTKLQQEVVDKMKEGYIIQEGIKLHFVRRVVGHPYINTISPNTTRSLLKKGIIEKVPGVFPIVYQFNEKYKHNDSSS